MCHTSVAAIADASPSALGCGAAMTHQGGGKTLPEDNQQMESIPCPGPLPIRAVLKVLQVQHK